MLEPPQVPIGCRVIPLWRNISGTNFYPNYQIVGYTVAEDADFCWLNQDKWFMHVKYNGDCYAYRVEHQGGKKIKIYMAREILGLPRSAGWGGDEADHKNHDTLDNRRENLRIATSSQNKMNTRERGLSQLPKGVQERGGLYRANVCVGRSVTWFIWVLTKIEAAWMRRYAVVIQHDKHSYIQDLPEDEKLSRERRWELFGMVVMKLKEKRLI